MAKDRNKNINNLSFVERMMLCPINFCIYSFIITFAEKGETNKKLMGCGDWHVDKIVKGDELAFRFFVDTYSKDLYYFVLFIRARLQKRSLVMSFWRSGIIVPASVKYGR